MAILAGLMSNDFSSGHWVVLFDEPENSLHADSQHVLRRLFEELASRPNLQVVYATHSPSMINPLRPQSVRLFRRETREEKATTAIDNAPFKGNFLPVRASLGLTPADSLLYAPVSIVVEGDTEAIGLPLLMLKLAKDNVEGFQNVEVLLSQCSFLDGMGDKLGFVCQMAKSQGAKPIIFVDGDKKRHLAQHKLDENHSDVPVVMLADGQEFEQLVPEDIYFQALAEIVSDDKGLITAESYRVWEKGANLPARMVFTKRVVRWLDSLGLLEPNKARVMRRAIELVDARQVVMEPLRQLLGEIERLLQL
jgi:predicted ATP-dependent endonuclease of OLD family